jgi:hypothetical protein
MKERLKQFILTTTYNTTFWFWDLLLSAFENRFITGTKEIFDGKRVAIVGPADCVLNTDLGDYIDGFDIVIRMNMAPLMVAKDGNSKDIGSRTDMLFRTHSESDITGGKYLFDLYHDQKTRYIVFPFLRIKSPQMLMYFFMRKYYQQLKGIKMVVFADADKAIIRDKINGKLATTGFSAIYSVLQSDFKECYITGFTFLKTGYVKGYRDSFNSLEDGLKIVKKVGLHDLDAEFEAFKKLIVKDRSKIKIDSTLEKLIA